MPVRIATIKKPTNHTCWKGCGEKGTVMGREPLMGM